MHHSLVLTIVGPDRHGLVETLSETIAAYDGNWVESRMATLAGEFAGLLWVLVPDSRVDELQVALRALESEGLHVVIQSGETEAPTPARTLRLDVVGHDRPGIVRDLARALRLRNVNVEELSSERYSAPMSGDPLFRARVEIGASEDTDMQELTESLEKLAEQMALDIQFDQEPANNG
jgi:glycine cleavage system regulatory protein